MEPKSLLHDSRALMIAFHFPPMSGSSGLQRSLGFARHLPSHGWSPIVIAPHSRAYAAVDSQQTKLIAKDIIVERSFCLDTARHLSIRGRYLDVLAIPDRWTSWIPGALISGMWLVRRYRPSVLWSTYPIASSHIIGHVLSKWTGIPWVADFRDPMVECDPRTSKLTPSDSRVRNARLRIERNSATHAAALVFCTDAAREICVSRYPNLPDNRCHVISNGFEESFFEVAERNLSNTGQNTQQGPIRLLHSGTIYPTPDRDPRPFFDAIANLKRKGTISGELLQVNLRATGHDADFATLISNRGIADIVRLTHSLPYIEALEEMMSVDGLVLLQGYTSNPAIPAKLYEYLRAGTPILALVDADGSTAKFFKSLNTGLQASIENSREIQGSIIDFLRIIQTDSYTSISEDRIRRYSRAVLTEGLATLFDAVRS